AACTTGSSATISVVQSAITNTECQTFDTQSSASAAGWVEDNSRNYRQNYGFSNSGNASGSAGEAGGVFYRTNFLTSYADTSIGTLTLNDYISADGKLFIAKPSTNNADAWVGFFNSTSTGTNTSSQPQSFLGIELSDNGDIANTRFRGLFGDSTGSHVAEVSANPTALLSYFTSYDWNFTYDPTGGPDGYGQMIWNVTIFGAPYSITNNLTVANRENGATFDRFGLINFVRSPRSDADPLEFYVDNLCYTTGGPVKLQNIAFVSANQLQITFTSFGTTHTVQWTPSLSPATWSTVTGVTFNGPSANNVWTAQFAVPAGGTGFFRVISSP
ncbi:MAG TPA: hypothetical protein VKA67_04610, partial [Verrucomicrobiae bacterium]|nr:hypothetical protein [Verrucomicrobiae bacterium]